MNKHIVAILSLFLISSPLLSADEEVTIRHLAPSGKIFKEGYYPNMWFYRTEIKNNTKKPLKVVWFEAYFEENGIWYAANILGQTMRGKEFSEWYTEGSKIINGVILPGEVATCDVNWHGGQSKEYINVKWSYILVDDNGNDYFVEKIVDPKIVKYVHYGFNKPLQPTPKSGAAE